MELNVTGRNATIQVLEALRHILIKKIDEADKLKEEIEDLCCVLTDLDPIEETEPTPSDEAIQQIRSLYNRFF